ncbi:hypothetical protein Rmet_6592 [Cupriavidus metallidurans CH34]|uniref:Uncharacterized protein n=1 Tax=Cupriavidus metallidurans (strain ATCC 43123 / DSM 2839 / NBRC 102507 / CH34) TaxID=266264 RepID=D3DY23_CUPMC|nr:hypothetical protein Rmet_6592 [Cupriavidus metallidurans CH34]
MTGYRQNHRLNGKCVIYIEACDTMDSAAGFPDTEFRRKWRQLDEHSYRQAWHTPRSG